LKWQHTLAKTRIELTILKCFPFRSRLPSLPLLFLAPSPSSSHIEMIHTRARTAIQASSGSGAGDIGPGQRLGAGAEGRPGLAVAGGFPDVGLECLELDPEPLAEGSFKRVFRARLRGASAVEPDGTEAGAPLRPQAPTI
jgi:hypothetical protein